MLSGLTINCIALRIIFRYKLDLRSSGADRKNWGTVQECLRPPPQQCPSVAVGVKGQRPPPQSEIFQQQLTEIWTYLRNTMQISMFNAFGNIFFGGGERRHKPSICWLCHCVKTVYIRRTVKPESYQAVCTVLSDIVKEVILTIRFLCVQSFEYC